MYGTLPTRRPIGPGKRRVLQERDAQGGVRERGLLETASLNKTI